MPDKVAAGHHSLADWDIQVSSDGYQFSGDFFVSSPTSIKFTSPLAGGQNAILCRTPETQLLPQGEVINWQRSPNYTILGFTFRNQSALGTATCQNCYVIRLMFTVARLYRYTAGVLRDIGQWPNTFNKNTWERYRVVWWNGKTPFEVPALCVDLYKEVGGEWVKQDATVYDTDNRWKDSAINRCGLYTGLIATYVCWYDDTQIWGPV